MLFDLMACAVDKDIVFYDVVSCFFVKKQAVFAGANKGIVGYLEGGTYCIARKFDMRIGPSSAT